MKKSGLVLLVFAFVVGLCGAVGAATKDTLVVVDQYDATTMDPIGHNDVPSSRACFEIYDTLIFLDDEGNASPGVAEKWEDLSPTEIKFYLRKGVKFHNGDELKAEDVKFSLERATTDAGAMIRIFSQNLEKVDIVDDYTVILKLKEADYYFFSSLAHSWGSITNKKYVEEKGSDFGMNPMGTGPFKFVSWQKGNKYVLERFDDFWGPKAKFKTLEVRSVPEPTSRTIELESGGADIAYPIAHNDLNRVNEHPNLVLYRRPQNSTTYLGFNMTKAPFSDIRVRHAISAALDVVGIQAAAYRGVGKVPGSMIPDAIKYSINAKVPPHVQDVERAKKLLEEAGVKDLKMEIWTNERKERVDSATIVQAQLEEIGVKAEIKVLEWGAYLDGLKDKKHDTFFLGWVSTVPHPNGPISGLLESNAGSNYTCTNDPKVDDLLRRGRGTPLDDAEQIYVELQEYINELTPMILFHNDESIAGTQKNVKGFFPRATEIHSFREVYFEE
ncbi:MAG: ABC transporter substrate-binding protein [Synergistaceae bacterium]|jgi:peptide/nickel transport system substrate-binding protein|nr:ABC transporter substrate-binding protein [Synergistaceae bacterium]